MQAHVIHETVLQYSSNSYLPDGLKIGTNLNPETNPNPTRSTDPNYIAKTFTMIIKLMIRFA